MAELELEHEAAERDALQPEASHDPLHARLHSRHESKEHAEAPLDRPANGHLQAAPSDAEQPVDDPLAALPEQAQAQTTHHGADASGEVHRQPSLHEPLLADTQPLSTTMESMPLSAHSAEGASPNSSDSDVAHMRTASVPRSAAVTRPLSGEAELPAYSTDDDQTDASGGALFGGLQTEDPDEPTAGTLPKNAHDTSQTDAMQHAGTAPHAVPSQQHPAAMYSPDASVQASMDLPISLPVRVTLVPTNVAVLGSDRCRHRCTTTMSQAPPATPCHSRAPRTVVRILP